MQNEQGNEISLFVDATQFARSVHADFDCTDCHSDLSGSDHPEGHFAKVECGGCHEQALEAYQKSVHAAALTTGASDAATCTDCHGKHDILSPSNPESRTHPLQVAMTCAACHSDAKIVKKYAIPIHDPLGAYRNSVHGAAVLSENNFSAATCYSCHKSHDIRALGDPSSSIYWQNVASTCGRCHAKIYHQYSSSIHGKAVARGIREAPTCTDCHGEHGVASHENPASPVHPLRVSSTTCERCHASELITQRFGISDSRVSTFEDSYHGLAIKGGSLAVANCASCHGIHNILPSSDPSSTINSANLQQTCGTCHKDVTENFVKGSVHLTASTTPGRVVQAVRRFYIMVIIAVIGMMVLHNAADFVSKARRILAQRGDE